MIPLLARADGTASRFKSYIIDCARLASPVTNIVDFELMHGYNEPTLVICHEPVRHQTCDARERERERRGERRAEIDKRERETDEKESETKREGRASYRCVFLLELL